ncbi:MAG: hypothetical protein U0792_13225 [Gemmataceae bacterium]
MKRLEDYYFEQVRGAPTVFIGGKLGPAGGGPASESGKKYTALREPIDEALEKAAGAKLTLTVAKGEKGGFTAKATVADLEAPGEKVMLRFALAEERIRFAGGNGIRYHHMVVRSMPGGVKGFAASEEDGRAIGELRPRGTTEGTDEVPGRVPEEERRGVPAGRSGRWP